MSAYFQVYAHPEFPARSLVLDGFLEFCAYVAVKDGASSESVRAFGPNVTPVAFVPAKSRDFPALAHKGKAVSIRKGSILLFETDAYIGHPLSAAAHIDDRAYLFSHGLRGVHGRPLPAFPVQEQLSVSAIESLLKAWRESAANGPERCPSVSVRMFCDNFVKCHGIGSHDILYIGRIFQASFYLEGDDSGLGEFFKPWKQVVVL
ncbi:unknown [Bacteroides sp. CAG:1060]|nr:unknown [Bacteroides sp. CAG:1060]